MNKLNFNELKNIKTPEDWIEKAVNIPKENKKSKYFYLSQYFIGSVACLVACCAISLVMFFKFSDMPEIPISPAIKVTENSQFIPQSTYFDNQITDDTDSSSTSQENNESGNNTDFKDSTQNSGLIQLPTAFQSTTQGNTPPTQKPTENNSGTVATEPSENPSQSPTTPSPTQGATQSPTQLPTQKPTDSSTNIEGNTKPDYTEPNLPEPPTDLPWIDEPTQGGASPNYSGAISIYLDENGKFSRSEKLYCHIKNYNTGYTYTDTNSSVTLMTIWNNNGLFVAEYSPMSKGLSLASGYYYITICDDYGNSVEYICGLFGGNVSLKE